jgi:hypothetical protein
MQRSHDVPSAQSAAPRFRNPSLDLGDISQPLANYVSWYIMMLEKVLCRHILHNSFRQNIAQIPQQYTQNSLMSHLCQPMRTHYQNEPLSNHMWPHWYVYAQNLLK